jgi:dihydrofolate synthase/folylpolyglutamate synthase
VHDFILKHKSFFEENSLSFFEMTVGMAFDFFDFQKVDIAIIEVGLGGRLDATNIINPEVSLITNIGLDHTSFLGDNIKDIAFEKAGIIKENTPIVISETQHEIKQVFIDKAFSLNAEISFADQFISANIETDLLGAYQQKNARGVSLVIDKLNSFIVSNEHKQKGFKNVVPNTGLQGRWQILQNNPKIICDTAHNKEGLSLTINQLLSEQFDELRIVFGVVADKDISSILSLLPKNAHYYFCAPNISRALPVDELYDFSLEFGLKGAKFNSVNEAFRAAKLHSFENDLIYVGGSTFIVSEII